MSLLFALDVSQAFFALLVPTKLISCLFHKPKPHLALDYHKIQKNSNTQTPSLVPRPFKRRRKGLVHTAHACAGVSIATGRVTTVIVRRFCMTCSSMDDKRRAYNRVSDYPTFFWSPLAHARAVCARPFLLLLKGLGTRLTNTILFLTHTYTQKCVLYQYSFSQTIST